MLLNLFTHIKGKPHPAQRRTASPAPCGSCKATRTTTPPKTGTAVTSLAERDPTHLCNTVCKQEGNWKQSNTQSFAPARSSGLRNTKESCCLLPAEIQFSGTFCCKADPLAAWRARRGGRSKASSPPNTPVPMGMETGSLPGSPHSEAVSSQKRLGRRSPPPCRSLHSLTPRFSKLRLSLHLRLL